MAKTTSKSFSSVREMILDMHPVSPETLYWLGHTEAMSTLKEDTVIYQPSRNRLAVIDSIYKTKSRSKRRGMTGSFHSVYCAIVGDGDGGSFTTCVLADPLNWEIIGKL